MSNDVENILIEQAFKIKKFQDSCQRNDYYSSNPYYYMNYMSYYQGYDYSAPQNYSQINQITPYQLYDSYAPNYPTNTFNYNTLGGNSNSFNVIYE